MKLKKIIKLILNRNIIFYPPKKTNILLFDTNLQESINKFYNGDFEVLHVRYEKINFFILFSAIIKFGFKNLSTNYILTFIRSVNPKVLLTFNDLNPKFYLIKRKIDPKITTIALQQSFRDKNDFNNFKLKKNFYNVDYLFVFSNFFKNYYVKKISAKKIIISGSFINNFYSIRRKKNSNILFISQYKEYLNDIKYYNHEKKLLKFLVEYSKKNKINYKVNIRLQTSNNKNDKLNKKISKKIYINKFEFLKKNDVIISNNAYQTQKKNTTYDYLNNFNNIITIDSSIGLEALARRQKIISFPLNPNFGSKKDFFLSKKLNYKNFCFLLNLIISMKEDDFHKKSKKSKLMISFDKDNKHLKNLILRLLNK